MVLDTTTLTAQALPQVPTIKDDESFAEISKKLALYIIEAVDSPLSWEDLRSSKHLQTLQPLIQYLSNDCHHTAVVAALVALKGHFKAIESDDNCDINDSRGYACELVAWQFVLTLSDQEALDYLLYELREDDDKSGDPDDEETGLLSGLINGHRSSSQPPNGHRSNGEGEGNGNENEPNKGEGFAEPFMNLNTLEIATVSGAKKFLSQRVVQDMVDSIWYGEIVFWDSLTVNAVKKPRFHGKRISDPWCRLRVPRYMKTFEIIFFVSFLALFYVVSLQRVKDHVTFWEILFYVFLLGFAFDEMDDFIESGAYFYSADIWSLWDIGILVIGVAFFVLRMIGLGTGHEITTEWAFSVLALLSLLLTPRIFSLLSLSPYYGSLLPCLKEMGKQFIRFLGFTLIIYLGFFSTFILLARGHFPLGQLSITVLKVFFGAGVVGFDIAPQVSPYLGLPVMIIFVCLTNQLLITSMMAHISNSLRQVLDSSREEYLYVYSVYVLEAVTSDKLTYFQAPFNLIPIILFRPLLLVTPRETARKVRIILLKVTHAPLIGAIWLYERWEIFALRREAVERAALSFGFDNIGITTKQAPPTPIKTSSAMVNRKHSLKGTKKVQVPASLLSKASKRTSKQIGANQGTRGRINTAPTIVEEGPEPTSAVRADPVPMSAVSAPGETLTPIDALPAEALPTADMATMMRMLKELSAQVEEVRSALVKHDQGAIE
ncbi:Calcium channel YVC1 [Cytospora mali]|uniref:Calcium channel YVC1 n=1 Tax=Cytospora mali TaxID=578113 RepID=A0A194USF5_CYTMA|nr:Calcium channel YVC1 [Valsa mali var. pyri (nom. inval.)]